MGMPIITPGNTTADQAITNLIESIAMQENSLSHILNAEGEKMESIIDMDGTSTEELLRMNKSAELMISAVTRLELILQGKAELFIQCPLVPENSMNGMEE
ncbi:hypothetical protein HGO97_003985 [Faecalicatena sp. AGMB00832]|uniref:Uncharacterized protein n=1 Tax=Faecalicatena faecalis TaxID=2726362 RepID=A0ABS6D0C6_9FIRM|nr:MULTISPECIES: hypothetical protein [Faecalicatena]MBU3874973.1 hypothetical protein [Faecalicatena faecalis]MCI6465622.1 hypothetical protein [Faecalicatena sp.]MDY5618105.1 hypothetical protein [Lachnospiraceae bacterium]